MKILNSILVDKEGEPVVMQITISMVATWERGWKSVIKLSTCFW